MHFKGLVEREEGTTPGGNLKPRASVVGGTGRGGEAKPLADADLEYRRAAEAQAPRTLVAVLARHRPRDRQEEEDYRHSQLRAICGLIVVIGN